MKPQQPIYDPTPLPMQPIPPHQYTPRELWDVYKVAVGHKSFKNGKLPHFTALGPRQLAGWQAVADYINNPSKG